MKNLITLLFSIFLSVGLFAQSTPVGELRVSDRSTALGFNIPVGTKVIALADSSYWVATVGVLGSNSINTAITSFLRINKPETDPIVRAIVGVVKSNGTTISRVKSGTDIVTINGDSLLKAGNIALITQSQLTTQLGAKIDTSTRAKAGGVATLDANGKVPLIQINDVLLGAVTYKDLYNATNNTPALPSASTENKGWYYIVSTAGTQFTLSLSVGDWIISNGATWGKVDNNNLIQTVFGRVGSITANTGDYTADQITETATRVFVTPAQKTVLSNTSGTNTGDNATNTQYSGLVTNATHDGDATGATTLTLATVNNSVGTYNNVTINAKGLATSGSNVAYWKDGAGNHPTTTVGYGLPDYPTTVTASNILGILGVPKGGTGNSVITPGSILQGNDVDPTSERTLNQLKADIGAADMSNYGNIRVESFAETTAGSTGQDNVLTNYPLAATSVQVAVNGSVLEPGKYTLTNKTVKATIPVYQYDKVTVTYGYDYSGDAAYADKWYGVERDITSSSADWTRIGYMPLHASLPVQNLLKGVLLNADRTVNYYLYPSDWSKRADNITASVLTGADGNVMVRKDAPAYWKFEQVSNIQRVKCSIYPIPGFTKLDTWNTGAYEASLTTGKLSSLKGVLPTTSRSETQFRVDARANGAGYNQLYYGPYAEIVWMFVVEYATTNFQKTVNGTPTAEGYKQGGLGNGVTTANGTEWGNYNGYNPFITCGSSDALANGSGQASVTIANFGGAGVNRDFNVPRYRGIENLFGHIWKWVDGVSFNHTANASEVWIFDNPDLIADNTSAGARFAGNLPAGSGWTSNVLFGSRGDILPSSVGGDPSLYFADYFWTPGYGSGWRALISSAYANSDVVSGPFLAYTHIGAGHAYSFIGARLFAK